MFSNVVENIKIQHRWYYEEHSLELPGVVLPKIEILILGNLDIFWLEDLICGLVIDSDTVFFDFLSMYCFGLGFVYTVELEAYWVGLHVCK